MRRAAPASRLGSIAAWVSVLCVLLVAARAQTSTGVARLPERPAVEKVAAAREDLALAEREQGAESPAVAAAAHKLARLLFASSAFAECEGLAARAVAIRERSEPDGSVELADACLLVGACRANAGCHAEAVPLYERCLRLRERLLGPANPHTLLALQNLYSSRMHSGCADDGLEALRQLIDRLAEHHPAHRALQVLRDEWITTCEQFGRFAEALPAALLRMEQVSAAMPQDVDATLRARFLVGHLLCRTVRFDEGLAHLDAVVAALPDSGIPLDQRLQYQALHAMHVLFADRQDAVEVCRAAWKALDAAVPGPLTAGLLSSLAMSVAPAEDVLPACRADVEACERLLGGANPNTAAALANLASAELKVGLYDEARDHAAKAIAGFGRGQFLPTANLFHARNTLASADLRSANADAVAAAATLQQNLDELPLLLRTSLPLLADHQRLDYAAGARWTLDLLLQACWQFDLPGEVGLRGVMAWKGVVARGLHQEMLWLREHVDVGGHQLAAERARWETVGSVPEAAAAFDLTAVAARKHELGAALENLAREVRAPTPSDLIARLPRDAAYIDYVSYTTHGDDARERR
ncbi:MAG: tetratricopeptide repeat protein, partial [Planctomycetota bacterium]